MLRRYIPASLIVAILAVLTVHATDFWISTDWKQWSKGECESLLANSPWAHIWRRGGPRVDELVYAVKLRSALPIREAIVRQLQIDQKYEKMTDVQRNSFDAQASQILNRNYDDTILFHVDFSKGTAAAEIPFSLYPVRTDATILDASLVTDDGSRVAPIRFDSKADHAFDLIFPRTKGGVPLIKDGQKHFSVQFQSPRITIVAQGTTIPSQRVGVQFDLSKTVVGGELILHEFGHVLGIFGNDSVGTTQSMANTQAILDDCGSAINQVNQ